MVVSEPWRTKRKAFQFSTGFWLLKHSNGILADTQLWLKERTAIMQDDKPVLSNSLIALGLIWWWLCIISGSKMFLDFFQDTQTADIFFWKPFKTNAHWKPLKTEHNLFKEVLHKSICKIFLDGCICPWLLCSCSYLQSNKKKCVCLACGLKYSNKTLRQLIWRF